LLNLIIQDKQKGRFGEDLNIDFSEEAEGDVISVNPLLSNTISLPNLMLMASPSDPRTADQVSLVTL